MVFTVFQVAGFILYYILTDGHLPHETTFPYTLDQAGIVRNLQKGQFDISHLEHPELCTLIKRMMNLIPSERPTIDECIYHFQGKLVSKYIIL